MKAQNQIADCTILTTNFRIVKDNGVKVVEIQNSGGVWKRMSKSQIKVISMIWAKFKQFIEENTKILTIAD